VVSPHRDDAAFSLGLSLGAWLAAGHAVEVVNCFTRSDYAPFSDAASLHENDRMTYVTAVRGREDQAWKRTYGAAARRLTITDLNLKDAPRRLRISSDEVCGVAIDAADKAMGKIAKALAGLAFDALLLPLAIGDHVDHRIARDAALRVRARAWALYEDLPYAARPGAAEEIVGRVAAIDAGLAEAVVGVTPDAVACKRRMARCYDSQIDDAVCGQIAGFSERYGGGERVWANPAWLEAFG
jgi:LmbE family N-acetylglucosaminyl deacetylase